MDKNKNVTLRVTKDGYESDLGVMSVVVVIVVVMVMSVVVVMGLGDEWVQVRLIYMVRLTVIKRNSPSPTPCALHGY